MPLQPIPVLVGPLPQIHTSYVVVNDVTYPANSTIGAVQMCLEIYMALDCDYPSRAQPMWVFLQKSLCNIHLDIDKCNASVSVLCGEVGYILKQTSNTNPTDGH